jgi:hypothetical protein
MSTPLQVSKMWFGVGSVMPMRNAVSSLVVSLSMDSKTEVPEEIEAVKRGTVQGRRMQSRSSFLFPTKPGGTNNESKQRT